MQKIEKFKNIELLRFILAIVIIFYHFFHAGKVCFGRMFGDINILSYLSNATKNGTLAVDMFFIIAGFFMFYTLKNISIKEFFLKKIVRLYPLVFLYAIVNTIFSYFVYNIPNYLPHNQILRLLLIDNIGLNTVHSGITWYVSVLFWVSLLYFYCFKYFDKKYLNLAIPITIIFCYSYLIHAQNGNINGHTQSWNYIFNAGVMRGLAGFGVGYFINLFYNSISPKQINKIEKILYTFTEGFLLYFVFNNLTFHHLKYYSNFIIIIGFIGLFILFLLKRGYISSLFENNISTSLGKYSYAIFIMHMFVLSFFNLKIWKIHPDFVQANTILCIIIPLFLSIVVGILTYHLIEKPCAKYLTQKFFPQPQTLAAVERERERERERVTYLANWGFNKRLACTI